MIKPQKEKLANILKGISILLKYDCTTDISINTNYYSPAYVIDTLVDSQDLLPLDLEALYQLGWKELDQGYYTERYYLD